LACFTRNPDDIQHALALKNQCASIYVELLREKTALARAGLRFGAGHCLTTAYYSSRRMAHHLESLRGFDLRAAVAFSSAMTPMAPAGIPLLTDMVDVDSEKYMQYAEMRHPGLLYRTEARRLREVERRSALRARCTFLTTRQEATLLESIAPGADVESVENGVDFEYFHPNATLAGDGLAGRRFVVFVGVMDYFPNADGCRWFTGNVLGPLRQRAPEMEFWIVGKNPSKAVRQLAERPGVVVTGSVSDVRPYLAAASAVVVPLRIARGVQNKVLEALAMGKRVFASDAVCRTLGELPTGVTRCVEARDYLDAITAVSGTQPADAAIRANARQRFDWSRNMSVVSARVDAAIAACATRQ